MSAARNQIKTSSEDFAVCKKKERRIRLLHWVRNTALSKKDPEKGVKIFVLEMRGDERRGMQPKRKMVLGRNGSNNNKNGGVT